GGGRGGKRKKGGENPEPGAAHKEQLDRRTHERDEALEQQAATSEVLRVISQSPGDLQPVFESIAASALRLCGSTWSAVCQFNGELIELAAVHNLDDFKGGETLCRSFPQGFNINLERSLDPAAGEADVFPQDITRALLNLISNGF